MTYSYFDHQHHVLAQIELLLERAIINAELDDEYSEATIYEMKITATMLRLQALAVNKIDAIIYSAGV
jgi:RecA-family ATPase